MKLIENNIQRIVALCQKYKVGKLFVFGSILTNRFNDKSDVDLMVSSDVKGLKFYGMVEELRTALRKKVDVLDVNQLKDNLELTEEMLREMKELLL